MKKIASLIVVLAIGAFFAVPSWPTDPAPAAKTPAATAEKGSSAAPPAKPPAAAAAPTGKEAAGKETAGKEGAAKAGSPPSAPPAATLMDVQNALQRTRRLGVALGQIRD